MATTDSKNTGISELIHIRPHQLLLTPDNFGEDAEIKFFMPPSVYEGSVSIFESLMLVKLLRCVNPSFIFEFGTYLGHTTRLLLENLPDNGISTERIYTLDLPEIEHVKFQGTDGKLAQEALNAPRKYLSSTRKNLVKQILQDSMALDTQPYLKKIQYIFVDANHEISYVIKDTENSLKMLAASPSCVIWHDYGNPQFPELTQYLEELSSKIKLYHIENTMLVFHLNGVEVAPRKK